MSDLTGGRAANNGARTGGPVPVSSSSGAAGVRTPRDVMRDRQERERRRQEEAAKAEEQRRAQAEERRRSAERRAQALSGGDIPGRHGSLRASSQYSQDQGGSERLSGGSRVASGAQYGEPTGRTSQDYPAPLSGRSRGPSVPASDQPRAAPATSGASHRPQASQSGSRPSGRTQGATMPGSGSAAGPSAAESFQPEGPTEAPRGSASTFPHAFERWEQLSSHWEGLTSYWLHKLEANQEEIARTVPSASVISRQITDLSAAGANLFHAVVELQRLRASSERKFQRWFFETRAENERNQEVRAQLEQQLNLERNARQEAARKGVQGNIDAENARREVAEMRRELMISKEEARRAWEELGRRNQESLETAQSLKDGRVTVVSGVQVVPYFGGPSRTGSASQRPTTREGMQSYSVPTSSAGAAGLATPGDEAYYQDRPSPTDTDPFTERRGGSASLHHEGGVQSLAAGTYYPVGGTPGSASTAQTAIPPASGAGRSGVRGQSISDKPQPPLPVTAEEAQQFYQQRGQDRYLRDDTQVEPSAAVEAARAASQGSFIDTLSEGEGPEYAIDAQGNILRDTQGQPIPFRGGRPSGDPPSQLSSDDYDTAADRQREAELAQQYGRLGGGNIIPPDAPSAPATSAQAMQQMSVSAGEPSSSSQYLSPDYEGSGYDRYDAPPSTRHHHPTRLSDVLEEEEERSSRRTGD